MSFARQLAAQAQLLFTEQSRPPFDVIPAALLAIESMRRVPTREGELALRNTTRLLPRVVTAIPAEGAWPVFTGDGRRVALREDKKVRLIDSATGAEVWRLVPEASVHEMAFSPDGSVLIVANEKTLQAAEVRTGEVLWSIPSNGRAFIVFSRDGARIVTHAHQAPMRLLDTRTGRVLWSVDRDFRDPVFSGDGRTVAALADTNAIVTIDTARGEEIRRLQPDLSVGRFVVGLDGRAVVAADNTQSAQMFAPWLSHPRAVDSAAAFSPSGNMLVLREPGGVVGVGQEGREIWRKKDAFDFAFSPDGRRVVLGGDGSLEMIDAASGERVWAQTYEHFTHGRTVAFSHDGSSVFVFQTYGFDRRRIVRVIDAGHGGEVARTFHSLRRDAIAGSDRRWVLETARSLEGGRVERRIVVFEAERPMHTTTLQRSALRTSVLGADGRLAPAAEDDGPLKQALVAKLPVTIERIFATVLSADKRWLAIGGEVQGESDMALGFVQVFDVGGGKPAEPRIHTASSTFIRDIVFSGDGTLLAVGAGADVQVFETSGGREVFKAAVSGLVGALGFSDDGRRLAVGAGSTAYVFDARTGDEQSRIHLLGSIARVRFAGHGRYLLTAADMTPFDSTTAAVSDRQSRSPARRSRPRRLLAHDPRSDGRGVAALPGNRRALSQDLRGLAGC